MILGQERAKLRPAVNPKQCPAPDKKPQQAAEPDTQAYDSSGTKFSRKRSAGPRPKSSSSSRRHQNVRTGKVVAGHLADGDT
ncbi:hypothetical protein DHEL01_v209934 [Diaporthe helianthi]|uniref:Uncharacterized protein n=1 Tax=Diaporthe helianthi TaxID=158607 RepID=A0A2P5HN63_DIAHE|nr:hypothetical protein DHEL01_v209934 [Diaporthe helianthi]